MAQDLFAALQALFGRLRAVAASDAELRGCLRDVARALVALAVEPDATAPPPSSPKDQVAAEPGTIHTGEGEAPAELVVPQARPEPRPPDQGQPSAEFAPNAPLANRNLETAPEPVPVLAEPSVPVAPEPAPGPAAASVASVVPASYAPPEVTDEDLPLIATRSRLKAEAARWAAARQRGTRNGDDAWAEFEPQYRELIARAKTLPDCYLWMCSRNALGAADAARLDEAAGCYDAMAGAADLLARVGPRADRPELLERAVLLAAEAQSALRCSLAAGDAPPDRDQLKVFIWLREASARRGFWIERFMRQDDPADPAGWRDLLARLAQADEAVRALAESEKRRGKLFGKVRYHVKRMEASPGEDHARDWQTVLESVTTLVRDGLPPSNKEIRDLLLPVLEELPDSAEPSKEFLLVLREIDRFLARRPPDAATAPPDAPTPEVRRAADLLRGRAVVLIGGDRRPAAAEALAKAFGLSELIWVEARDQSYTDFEPDIARPDVAVVILAIRWSRHGFGEVKHYCERYGKPLVRLPGGYSPNQVAFHVLSQVGGRLVTEAERVG